MDFGVVNMYKLMKQGAENSGCIIRTSDGASFLQDPDNTDYVAYLAWLAEGNEPLPADQPE